MKHPCVKIILPVVLAVLFCTSLSTACPIPVFRYAMERWEPHTYDVVVFHRGPLTADEARMVDALREFGADGKYEANFVTRDVNLAEKPDEKDAKLWADPGFAELPRIAVYTPADFGELMPLWSGPLNPQTIKNLIDSPVRREIVRRLASGESAVWILLESGNREKDDALAAMITKELAEEPKVMELTDEAKEASSSGGPELKIAFSLIRLSRTDPAEAAFVGMLLTLVADGKPVTQDPVAIPVFGRGRALTALIDKDITADNLRDCGYFMTGGCACTVKEANPGVDLLISANWDQIMSTGKFADPNLPSLAGLARFAPATSTAPAPIATQPAEPSNYTGNQSLYINILIIAGAGVVVIAALTVILARRRKPDA